ncbi:pentatricopeptide repeat-containing protein [Canna indica]|uniref:Pentatricopeptide repeat-containing protein n=1 Tax=Canna indica TaxID=4628 RepID=A0AAQ3KWA6_9LILI|nr:pentatricopeptide repeat-containing protein [Canna indica]
MTSSCNPTSPCGFQSHPISLVLRSCPKSLSAFNQVHAHFITSGLARHTFPLSRLLLLLSSLPPSLPHAASLLSSLPPSSPFLLNTLLSSLADAGRTHLALSLYSHHLLQPLSPPPNNHTFPSLLKACVAAGPPFAPVGRALHAHILKFLGHDAADHFARAALLSFYSRCGKVAYCRRIFDRISNPDLPAWNCMLSAYARCCSDGGDAGSGMQALFLFRRLQLSSAFRPNEITLVALISSCGDLGALGQGIWAHAYVELHRLVVNQFVATALIEMYSKCGRLDLAEQVFVSLPQKDMLCYNAMIRGFGIHGRGQQAVELFNKMTKEGVSVDEVTFVVVTSSCAHAGLVDEGERLFYRMQKEFEIEPKIEHYGCLVDLLGRSGKLEEAEKVIQSMPMKPNAILFRSLLTACAIHNNIEMGERVISQLMHSEPEHGGNYVLLSNMYARVCRWDGAMQVRKVMKDKGIDKTPGSSLVEIDGCMHEFLMGDKTHPLWKEIYAMLDEMDRRLHEFGYMPRTKDVLFDVEEEDKEDALSYHSERLAIAFALLSSDPSVPIRIIKNLRVCGDCHLTTKLISGIYRREIIVRDRSRFHHFRSWTCSCLDYW